VKLYNTLTRSLEPFTPLAPPDVTMYVCGPTVYDEPHIGHARSAYTFDVLRRYLAHKGYRVKFVRNVTDVDDKIIQKAREELGAGDLKTKCREVADRYLESYHKTLDRLGILPPDIEPKATEHVVPDPSNVEATRKIDASMTGFISQLITKNMAYPADGDVYFSVRKFTNYGRLSNRSIDELQAGGRVEPGEKKEDPLDFALWKAAKPDEPSWNSPWGPGRPGWHIECSVMSTAYLGDAFDIHGGGVDLVFPHHENEIAQAQAAGKPFAKYWVHNGLLMVNGEKMSKSLGNFITVERALQDAFQEPDALKVFFLGAQYRSPMDYTQNNILAAASRLDGWVDFLHLARNYRSAPLLCTEPYPNELKQFKIKFFEFMDNDLNTPAALAVLDRLIAWGYESVEERTLLVQGRQANEAPIRYRPSDEVARLHGNIVLAADTVLELARILGVLSDYKEDVVPEEIMALVNERELARGKKEFEKSDVLRKQIEELGFIVADTSSGPVIRKKR